MSNYKKSKSWADKFHKAIIADINTMMLRNGLLNYEITEADIKTDQTEATDYQIIYGKDQAIAARVRRNDFSGFFDDGFVMRYSRPSRVKTEFEKVVFGHGDYYIYSLASADEKYLERTILIDLHNFRAALILEPDIREDASVIPVPNGVEMIEFKWNQFEGYSVVIDEIDRRTTEDEGLNIEIQERPLHAEKRPIYTN